MSSQLIITLIILTAALILFLSERLSVDLVAFLVLIALGLSRVLTPQEVFSGFSDPAVITILAIFMLAHSLEVTGVAERLGEFLVKSSGKSETRLIITLMSSAAFMSLFMNNIAVVSILLPASSGIARQSGVKLSRLLIPLSFGSLLGGMATLFTTTNIVVSGVLRASGYRSFGVLDFAPLGLVLVFTGITYMAVLGRKLLPGGQAAALSETAHGANESDLFATYRIAERLFRVKISYKSAFDHKTLAESGLREDIHVNLVAVERNSQILPAPAPDFVLQRGDILLLEGRLEEFAKDGEGSGLEILEMRNYSERDLESNQVAMVEVVLAPRSRLIGQTIREAHLREKYGMTALGVWNGERNIRSGLSDRHLEFGDALLLHGQRHEIPLLRSESDLIVLSNEEEEVRNVSGKGFLALTIFALAVITAASGFFSVSEVMLTGAMILVISGVVSLEQIYRTIEWRIIFLVAGVLPLGLAMTKTGATALFAHAFLTLVGPFGPMALLLGLLILTVLLSQAMKGAAVSAVVAPVAIQAALLFGVDPRAMAMGVAMATSLAFITPLGHPVNILVMGPGGYTFKDFFKVGLPLTLLLLMMIMIFLPIFWPLKAG